jgi:hypothetical protein
MRKMKLPYLRTRKYTNKAGEVWVGYYYEPPRGSGGEPGIKPKPIALGNEMLKPGATLKAPPPEVLQAYSKATGTAVKLPSAAGTVAAVYARWHIWAKGEVRDGRLSARTLKDYEEHWKELEPIFGAGMIDALTQPVMLGYFDRRTSKDRGKREVNFIGQLCGWARPRGYMTAANPVDRNLRENMKVQKTKRPTVPDDVYWTVWYCGDQLVKDMLDVSLMVACRPFEAIRVAMPGMDDTEMPAYMPKTKKSGRAVKMVPIEGKLKEIIDRRRATHPMSLYILFDENGQELRKNGLIRSRFYKARDLARAVCKEAGIKWVEFARTDLRPTAITQVDKDHGRQEARKLAGHTTEKQTAHYVRHDAELVTTAALPALQADLFSKIDKIKAELASKESHENRNA